MKLGTLALLEIVNIVQVGLLSQTDVSQMLRDLDLEETEDGVLELSSKYSRHVNEEPC